jgi:hypothetical protein
MTFEEMIENTHSALSNGFDGAVFVGRRQNDIIRRGARATGAPVRLAEGPRMEFVGLPVYVVDADNYFRVS